MAKDLFFNADLSIDPKTALQQQGESWTATHRELAIPDNGSLDILVNVASSANVIFSFSVTGVFHGTFNRVNSLHNASSKVDLGAFNNNTIFQETRSGDNLNLISHTASYAVVDKRWDFILGTGGNKQSPVGGSGQGSLILGPGLYNFTVQNVAGAAADLNFNATWEEPFVPNAPVNSGG